MTRIAALTIVRTDSFFLKKWVAYYGAAIGLENLHVVLRGDDWVAPDLPAQVNVSCIPAKPMRRTQRNRLSARHASQMAADLLTTHDAVLRTDVDEFIVADPANGTSLSDTVLAHRDKGCVSALGIDVIHDVGHEPPLPDDTAGILAHRRRGVVTREFTKPVAIFHPVAWGPGSHRADHQEVRIASDLFLFHLALHDYDTAERRLAERADQGMHATQVEHGTARLERFAEARAAEPVPGDDVFQSARDQIARPRPNGRIRTRTGHITKGANLPRGILIEIPERFARVL